MPTSSTEAAARLGGDVLHLSGRLDRQQVPGLWPALPGTGYARIDLAGVSGLDTVGLALVAHLAARASRTGGGPPSILNAPTGFAELCAAYRLPPDLR